MGHPPTGIPILCNVSLEASENKHFARIIGFIVTDDWLSSLFHGSFYLIFCGYIFYPPFIKRIIRHK